jgi:hypothetical protein
VVDRLHERNKDPLLLGSVIIGIGALCALATTIGADSHWLAALGQVIAAKHAVPSGVPFATAPTAHWPNTIALAELMFHYLEAAAGDRGLMIANLLAVVTGLSILAGDALAGRATAAGTAVALLIAALGAFPSLAIARDQLFSIALFPLVIALLRNESRAPSRRIWLIPVCLLVWSNLHGAVLIGLGVTLIYLLLERRRGDPGTAAAVSVASVAAVCATPAGVHTIDYYRGVLSNVAAQRGQAQWASLSLSSAKDLLLIASVTALGYVVARKRGTGLRVWELVAVACLATLTISASRSGVWLLLFMVGPAARAMQPRRNWVLLHAPITAASLFAMVLAVGRGPLEAGVSRPLVTRAIQLARGTPVLADDVAAEQIALAGGRVWISDPIDAFSPRDQTVYLDWTQGSAEGRLALDRRVEVVIVRRGSPAQGLTARSGGFVAVESDRAAVLYVRRASQSATPLASQQHGVRKTASQT